MTNSQKISPTRVVMKWVIIYVVLEIALTYIWQFFNIDLGLSFFSTGLCLFPIIVFTFLSQKQYRDQLGGYMTFGEGFSAGFRFTIISTLLLTVFVYLYMSLFNPDMFERSLTHIRTRLIHRGKSPQQIEMTIRGMRRFGAKGISLCCFFFYGIMGLLISLAGAVIFRRKNHLLDTPYTPTA